MEKQSTSKLLRLMVAVFALFLLVMTGSVLSACGGNVAHEHKYGSPEHTNPSTCGSTGYDVYTCSECGDKYAIVTAATGKHTFQDGYCTVCGVSNGEDLKKVLDQINSNVGTTTSPENAHQHNFSTTVMDTAPMCVTFGLTVKKCDCGSTAVTDFKKAEGHTYKVGSETGDTIKSTCTTDGQIRVRCSVCKEEYWRVNENDRAQGHKFTVRDLEVKKLDKAATCIAPSRYAYKCENCNEIQYVDIGEINKDAHNWGEWTEKKDENANANTKAGENETEGEGEEEGPKDIPMIPKVRACTLCGATQEDEFPAEHTHDFTHLSDESNKIKHIVDPDCEKNTFDYRDETCTVRGSENWQCIYKGCTATEFPMGEWVETKNAQGVQQYWDENNSQKKRHYVPSGFNPDKPAESTENAEPEKEGEEGQKLEYRKPLGHEYEKDSVQLLHEVDKNEDGSVVTERNQNETKNNTTTWWGTVCKRCEKEIAFKEKTDETTKEKGPDYDDVITFERDEKGYPIYNDESDKVNGDKTAYLKREWHAWVKYEETNGTSTVEVTKEGKKETIKVPNKPTGFDDNQLPNCTDDGRQWYWCQDANCMGSENPLWVKVILPALGHDWYVKSYKAPTCEDSGELELECQREKVTAAASGTTGTTTAAPKQYCDVTLKFEIENETQVESGKKFEGTKDEKGNVTEDWTWFIHTQEGNTAWKSDGVYKKGYLDLWDLKAEPSNTKGLEKVQNAKNGWEKLSAVSVSVNKKGGTAQEGDPHSNGTDHEKVKAQVYKLSDILKLIVPTGHHWKDVGDNRNVAAAYCYGVPSTVYKCDCENTTDCCKDGKDTQKLENCSVEWRDSTPKNTHDLGEHDEMQLDTYLIYGACGTAFGKDHTITKVTYCKICGLQVGPAVVLEEQSYRHFPFDRTNLDALYNNYIPEGYTAANGERLREDAKLSDEQIAWMMTKEARDARLLYARLWKAIDAWWFNNDTTVDISELRQFFFFKSGNSTSEQGFSLYCFDCFNNQFENVSIHTCKEGGAECELEYELMYFVKDENGAFIQITDANKFHYNACEYQFFAQYKVSCKCSAGDGKKCGYVWYGSDPNGKYGAGQYVPLSVDADGKEVIPTGQHYLVPVQNYWTKENFVHNGDSATFDWVCVFCGKTFELEVKYQDPTAKEFEEAVKKGEYVTDVVLADAQLAKEGKLTLLVDLSGLKFGTTDHRGLNDRWPSADGAWLLQINNKAFSGVNKQTSVTAGQKKLKAGAAATGTEQQKELTRSGNPDNWYYEVSAMVAIQQKAEGFDIVVGRRAMSDSGSSKSYFEQTSSGTNWWSGAEFGSILRMQDIVSGETFTKAWDRYYDVEITEANKSQETQLRKAAGGRLDDLLRRGGEIVLGDDVHNVIVKADPENNKGPKWDIITKGEGEKAEKFLPLGSLGNNDAAIYQTHVHGLDGTECESENCTQGTTDNHGTCSCDSKYHAGDKCDCYYVPVLNLQAGTTLDLNGKTLYANIWVKSTAGCDDGAGHTIKGGEVTVKNGTIVMSPNGSMQLSGEGVKLTLDNVQISGGRSGVEAYTNAKVSIKNSSIISRSFTLTSNATQGKADFELINSAFVSTEETAFYMPQEGQLYAKDCEFYGYDMGAYIRGKNLKDQTTSTVSYARFENCLFAKGDQSSGVETAGNGTYTKHFAALVLGSDTDSDAYGSIDNIVLLGCEFKIVGVANKHPAATATVAETKAWKPECEADNGGFDLKLADSDCTQCSGTTPQGDPQHDDEKGGCTHRLLVLNINGCKALAENGSCMSDDNVCTKSCDTEDANGKLTLHLDQKTYDFLAKHAPKCQHKTPAGLDFEKDTINPFCGCVFTDGEPLNGKCCKLKVYIIGNDGLTDATSGTVCDYTKADAKAQASS